MQHLLWSTEGAFGLWKGTNPTFLYNVLLSTLTTFLRSLLCAALALPDPALATTPTPAALPRLDILASPSPPLSLLASLAAATLSATLLAPLDTVRTFLMLTTSSSPSSPDAQPTPRGTWPLLRTVPAYCAPALALPTLLHGALPTLAAALTPAFLRARLGLDPRAAPAAHAAAALAARAAELAVRLPVETALRRGQMAVALQAVHGASRTRARGGSVRGREGRPESTVRTVVPIGRYAGLFGTMRLVVFEEGSRPQAQAPGKKGKAPERRRSGQGLAGLWRGWRVGAWGLAGMWGAGIVGGGARGGEF